MENRNKLGRFFVNGKELSEDLRRIVIDNLVEGGANVSDLQLPRGLRQRVSKKFGISANCISSIWKRYVTVGTVRRRPRRGGPSKTVQQEDVDHIAVLKTINPTMALKSVKDNILQYSNTLQNISLPTVSNIIRKDLHMTPVPPKS